MSETGPSIRQKIALLLLAASWVLFGISLLGPAGHQPPQQWNFVPDPLPEFLLMYVVCLSAVYLTPQWTPLSISLICFVLTPFIMVAKPRSFVRFVCRAAQLSLLFPWLWWLWDFWQGLHQPPASRGYWMWGFYVWASSFTLAWLATIIQPAPPRKPRPDRRRGFPIVPLTRDDNFTTDSTHCL